MCLGYFHYLLGSDPNEGAYKRVSKELITWGGPGWGLRLNDTTGVQLLNGTNPNTTDACRNTPLHGARLYTNYECVEMLLQHGAVVNALTHGGFTALDSICEGLPYLESVFKKFDESVKTFDLPPHCRKSRNHRKQRRACCIECAKAQIQTNKGIVEGEYQKTRKLLIAQGGLRSVDLKHDNATTPSDEKPLNSNPPIPFLEESRCDG